MDLGLDLVAKTRIADLLRREPVDFLGVLSSLGEDIVRGVTVDHALAVEPDVATVERL